MIKKVLRDFCRKFCLQNLEPTINFDSFAGVTIPSQRRYVEYYATLLNMCLSERAGSFPTIYYSPPSLHILELVMQPPPALNGGQGSLEFCVYAASASQKV